MMEQLHMKNRMKSASQALTLPVRKGLACVTAALLCCLLSSTGLLAQGSDGTILGVVKDSTSAVIPDAQVTIRNVDTNVERKVVTDKSGYFNVSALTPGTYQVRAEHAGFSTISESGLVLTVSQQMSVNFTLPVGSESQVVEVSTEGSSVNTVDNAIGGLVSQEALQNLPLNGRNYVDLVLMEPGTDQDYAAAGAAGGAGAQTFSNHGSTPWSNLFTLDGAILNNALALNSASQTGNTLGLDGIQEFKIVGIPDASYGLVMGGQIVMQSRGGTNQYHGSLFEYIRNNVFDARNFFDYGYRTPPNQRIAHFSRNQFGGSFGGPIKKDKTFFFGTYESLRSSQGGNASGAPIISNVPAAGCHGNAGDVIWNGAGTQPAGSVGNCPQISPGNTTTAVTATISPVIAPLLALYPNPNLPNNQFTFSTHSTVIENYGQMRVDHTLSAADSLFARYTVDRGTLEVPQSFPQWRQSLPGTNQFLTLGETHIFSSALLNVLRLSVSRTVQNVNTIYTSNPYIGPQYSYVTGLQFGGWGAFGGLTGLGPQTNKPSLDNLTLYTVADDVSLTKGKHTMRFGTLLNLFRQAAGTNGNAPGTLSFGSVAGFLQGQITAATVLSLPPGIVASVYTPTVNRYFGYSTYGFYAQDNWRTTSRLTLDFGLRYEPMDTVNELNGNGYAVRNLATDTSATKGAIFNNSTLKNFSPRVGFALDVFGDSKTSLRGGYGIYRDIGNIGSELREQIQGTPPYGITTVGAQTLATLPFNFSGGVVGKSLQLVNYATKPPYASEYNLTLERQIFGAVVSGTYVGVHGVHLWTRGEGNPVTPLGYMSNGQPFYPTGAQPACELKGVTSATTGLTTFCRTNPFYSVVVLNSNGGGSSYNSGELNIQRRLSRGVEFQTSYTWSKSLDDTEDLGGFEQGAAGCATNSDPLDRRTDRGPSCFDTTNKWNVNVTYHLPGYKGNSFTTLATSGWYLGNIVTIQSGVPFTPIAQQNRSNSGVFVQSGYDDHLNLNTAASIAANPCTSLPGQKAAGSNPCAYTPIPFNKKTVATHGVLDINPAMFSLQPTGTFGNASRDMLRSPYLLVWNTSLVKDTAVHFLGDKGNLQFRAEVFNPLNKANFGIPAGALFAGTQTDTGPYSEAPLSSAGQITSTLTSSRQMQFALKLQF